MLKGVCWFLEKYPDVAIPNLKLFSYYCSQLHGIRSYIQEEISFVQISYWELSELLIQRVVWNVPGRYSLTSWQLPHSLLQDVRCILSVDSRVILSKESVSVAKINVNSRNSTVEIERCVQSECWREAFVLNISLHDVWGCLLTMWPSRNADTMLCVKYWWIFCCVRCLLILIFQYII